MNTLLFIEQYGPQVVNARTPGGLLSSVSMAQLILETGSGTSYLFKNANNGFGVKAFGGWTGPVIVRTDYAEGSTDPYRVYNSVQDSIRDHEKFLQENARYANAGLFATQDYREQAYALKRAGYATASNYAEVLIKLIEQFELYKLDSLSPSGNLLTFFLFSLSLLFILIFFLWA